MPDLVALRDAFGEVLLELGRRNPKVVALTADLAESLRMVKFEQEFPDRFFEVGVAEENLVGVAAGMALGGLVPFAGSFGCFLTRGFDHVRVSVCQNNLHVVLVGSHGGVSNAADGASAHALEDLAMMRALPNMTVVVPADAHEMQQAVCAAAEADGPVYLRLYREPTPLLSSLRGSGSDRSNPPVVSFEIGKAVVEREGRDVTVVGIGPQVATALEVAASAKSSLEVINARTLQPFDAAKVVASAKKTGRVVTIEDHNVNGGLGSTVAEALAEAGVAATLTRLGLRSFGESGHYPDLIKKVGLDAAAVRRAVESLLDV